MAVGNPAEISASPRRWAGPERRFRWTGRHWGAIAAVVAVALVAASSAAVWAVTSDRHESHLLLPGTVIGGVEVGGMRSDQAVETLKSRLEAPLHKPILVQADGFEARTSAWDLGERINISGAVGHALDQTHSGNLISRTWHRVFGDHQHHIALAPKWPANHQSDLIAQAAREVAVPAQDARLDTSSGFVNIVGEKVGRALDPEGAKRALDAAVGRGSSQVTLPTVPVPPHVRQASFSTVVLVRIGENKLYLYKDGAVAKTYGVASGQPAYPTPTGTWRVTDKLVNPVWVNPNSTWSTNLPPKIDPGPNNPLGIRALKLNASGILIHATSDTTSIGYSASHGCIRMLPSDELDLFPQVPVGTPVIVIAVGPPKPRPAPTPAATPAAPPTTATPAQMAVVQY